MEQSLLLAKVIGPVLAFASLTIVIRRRRYIAAFAAFAEQPMLRYVIAMVELLAGAFLVVMHPHWSGPPAVIVITALGWVLTLEGAVFLWLSDAKVARVMRVINRPQWYVIWGAAAFVLGMYLTAFGYGWIA